MNSLSRSSEYYTRSQHVLAGPSTFSKGPDQFAYGITPYVLEKGEGVYVWDVDGNRYLDTMMALGAVTLGYRYPEVEEAIRVQLEKGLSFSLAHFLEVEIAEMICERIPCAEKVRLGKNGNDVTSAAVRLARYVMGKDHILFCGYHGWQDWYICQTSMNGGIPEEVKRYSHRFPYNDLEGLEELLVQYKNQTACIIMEPVSRIPPKEGYLQGVRDLADKYETVLIFDEVVTGFRFHRGGYQSVCGVIPDLACFSKAMGNGMPIAALVGKTEIMRKSPDIFFSLTFAGETLSLAAAKAVMEVIDKEDAPAVIEKNGQYFLERFNQLLVECELASVIRVEGFPCRNVLIFSDHAHTPAADIRTFWIQELSKRNILTAGYHIISLSHTIKEIDNMLDTYQVVLKNLKESVEDDTLSEKLQCPSVRASARETVS
ncbi:MAG: aminotransferase class III-fold pyridoxal phosphate-dependent enzyme [bacterium]